MAVTYGFYDSLNHDRLYNAQQMSAIFDGIINDGVFMSVGNQFHTVAGTGMQVIVKSGRAWFDSTWTLNDAEYPLSIDAADVLLTRIDAVVLEVNSEVATRANTIKVVKGTPASTPAKPTLTNTATIHQHALAYVTVAKNTTAITNSMIEIVVGKTETPYVTAILQTTDITDLYNQWEDYFQTWFDTVRGTLDGDVALNLQNQITSLRRETLKNTTPPIIGLPASATPDDMFQALGNTGELHVWRKTVVSDNEKPAGYTLDEIHSGGFRLNHPSQSTGGQYVTYKYSSELSVSETGVLSLGGTINSLKINDGTITLGSSGNALLGKFCIATSSDQRYLPEIPVNTVVFFPNDAVISGGPVIDKYQSVTGYPLTPAGTTTTYPVSTNPNAYQEGDDAKAAGYVVGEVVTGQFKMSERYPTNGYYYKYASSISVADNGTISLNSPSEISFDRYNGGQSYANSCLTEIAGKFVYLANRNSGTSAPDSKPPFNSVPSGVVYIPSDATLTWTEGGALDGFILSKYQPVTGYAAIPAGTTIEYLGKLGDKARVQVVSYVGTGTYGEDHPNSLTFNFVPKVVMIRRNRDTNIFDALYGMKQVITDFSNDFYVTVKWSKKTLSWYSVDDTQTQMNDTEDKYYAIAIG